MPLPQITVIGNLTGDAQLRMTNSGKAVAKLRVASNERKKTETGEWVDADVCFTDITVWRNAEDVSRDFLKGDRVIIVGTLRQRDYTTEAGDKRTAYEVNADHVARMTVGAHKSFNDSTPAPAVDAWSAPFASTADSGDVPF